MAQTILVVDDEQAILSSVKDLLQDEGYQVALAQSGEQALTRFQSDSDPAVDAVLLDIWLPEMDGIEVLKQLRGMNGNLPVIMLSGHANIDTAVTATKHGAYHFVEKPFSAETLLLTLNNALRQSKLEQENVRLRNDVQRNQHQIVGNSAAFRRMMEQIERAAASDA